MSAKKNKTHLWYCVNGAETFIIKNKSKQKNS